jgi:hypothetical protein
MVYDVKHDRRHKVRLVASHVISVCGIWLAAFLARLNSLELWEADVGNAYLEAKTKEKVYIVGGPESGPLEGHTLLVDKALYGSTQGKSQVQTERCWPTYLSSWL